MVVRSREVCGGARVGVDIEARLQKCVGELMEALDCGKFQRAVMCGSGRTQQEWVTNKVLKRFDNALRETEWRREVETGGERGETSEDHKGIEVGMRERRCAGEEGPVGVFGGSVCHLARLMRGNDPRLLPNPSARL